MNEVRYCKRCGRILVPSEIEGYQWECKYCDEDFYSFETLSLEDRYEMYENLPVAQYFWSQSGDYQQYFGKPFKIVKREIQNPESNELTWIIQFENGDEIWAYADEIFLPIMKDNGYKGK